MLQSGRVEIRYVVVLVREGCGHEYYMSMMNFSSACVQYPKAKHDMSCLTVNERKNNRPHSKQS